MLRDFITSFVLISTLSMAYLCSAQVTTFNSYYDQQKKQIKEIISFNTGDSTLMGDYIMFFQNGNKKVEGQYDRNKAVGLWTYYYETGRIKSQGFMQNDLPDGLWKQYYENGRLKSEGRYIHNQKKGIWTQYFENGNIKMAGNYANNEKNGLWKYYYEDGNTKALAQHDSIVVKYREYYPSGSLKSDGWMQDDVSIGSWNFYHENGKLAASGSFEDGQRNGMWMQYYPNDSLQSVGRFEAGNKVGEWKYYHANGQLMQTGKMTDDQEDGVWNIYDDQGNLSGVKILENGNGGVTYYHPGGAIASKGQVKDGKQHGKWEYFTPNGQLDGEAEFENGSGLFKVFHPNGNLRVSGMIVDEKKQGTWTIYDENGQPKGSYKPIYDEKYEPSPIATPAPQIFIESPIRSTSEIPLIMISKKKRSNSKINEYTGLILSSNPIYPLLGKLPLAAELYQQEFMGHEVVLSYLRNPFFTKDDNVDLNDLYYRGLEIEVKQKFYFIDQKTGMVYLGHALGFQNKTHSVNSFSLSGAPLGMFTTSSKETNWSYGAIMGLRWMKDTGRSGFTFDAFAQFNLNFRQLNITQQPTSDLDLLFGTLNSEPFYTSASIGMLIGFASNPLIIKRKTR